MTLKIFQRDFQGNTQMLHV